jgi:hypothetical protein
MKYAKLPCPKCIVLAACKSKDKVSCSLLFDYHQFNITDEQKQEATMMRRIRNIEAFFERELLTVDYEKNEILIKWILRGESHSLIGLVLQGKI